jgi:hypothetical protein
MPEVVEALGSIEHGQSVEVVEQRFSRGTS